MVELLLPWDRQPQEPAALDMNDALARRVIVAATPLFSATPAGARCLAVSTPTVPGPKGLSVVAGAGSYIRASAGTPVVLPGRVTGATSEKRDFTVAFVGRNIGTDSWVMDRQGGGSYPAPADLYRDSSGNIHANTGSGSLFTSVPWPTTAMVTIVSMGRYDNGAVLPRVWFDGVGTDGNTSQDSYGTATIGDCAYFGSAAFPSSNFLTGSAYALFIFRDLFSEANARAFTDAVWRRFRPRFLGAVLPAPGGATITLSASCGTAGSRAAQVNATRAASAAALASRGLSAQAYRTAQLATAAAITKAASTSKAAAVPVAASRTAQVNAIRSAATTALATIATLKARFLTLAAAVGATATVTRAVAITRTAAASVQASVTRAAAATRAAATTAAATLVRQARLVRSAGTTALATIATLKARFLTLTATLAASATLAKQARKTLLASLQSLADLALSGGSAQPVRAAISALRRSITSHFGGRPRGGPGGSRRT